MNYSSNETLVSPGDDGERALNEDELWTQLRNAISLRTAENQALWSIFGIFAAANAIALVALFTTGDLPASRVGIIISAAGAIFSIVWYMVLRRALGHVYRYENLMRRIEDKLGFDHDYAVSAEINRRDYDRYLRKRPRARTVMLVCTVGAFLLWALLLSYFVLRTSC